MASTAENSDLSSAKNLMSTFKPRDKSLGKSIEGYYHWT